MTDRAAALFCLLSRKTAYKGFTHLEVVEVEQMRGDGTIMRMRREIESHGSGAAVLVYDARRRSALLVRQLRVAVGVGNPDEAFLLEAIAGLVDHAGDDAADTARREAVEEAGVYLGNLAHVGAAYSSPGLSTEHIDLFLAEADFDHDRRSEGGGLVDEHEDIEVVEVPLADLARMADDASIRDLKTLTLIQTLRLRRPDLF